MQGKKQPPNQTQATLASREILTQQTPHDLNPTRGQVRSISSLLHRRTLRPLRNDAANYPVSYS